MFGNIQKKQIKFLNRHYYFMYNNDVRMGFDCNKWSLEAALQRFFNLAGHIPGLKLAEVNGSQVTPIYPEEKPLSKYNRKKEREAYFARQKK
jgi:hypothetical protein